jgi:hypothetical protein
MTAAPPIVGTETYIAFADADALANDRLNAAEWRAAVAAFEGDGIPAACRQALITAAATLSRMSWEAELSLPLAPDSIPPALATACAELAFYLLSAEGRRRRTGVQMEMIGQAMVTYFPEVADELPKHVRRLVEPLLRVRSTHCAELLP